jgi:hydroxypyruvate isomerase
MANVNGPTRRDLLTSGLASGAAMALSAGLVRAQDAGPAPAPKLEDLARVAKNGRIKHSACLWCYRGMKAAELAPIAKRLGLSAIDLLTPKEFKAVQEHGLICSMTSGVWGGITRGLNRAEHHEKITKSLIELADATAEAGFPNVICFSGNREGQSDEDGLRICAEGIKKVIGHFEKKKVTLCMELLNSRVDHADYQCDHTEWGVELCKAVGSERFRLLYDIYHMQIMEGDIIATIRKHHEYIGHYHTGGVPGRREIDETQELYYPAIMKAIIETGFKGYVAQEFVPARKDMIASLAQAVQICDV